jgi:hypothetical protein
MIPNSLVRRTALATRPVFRARAAGILAAVCLAVGLGGPVGSASAAVDQMGGFTVHTQGGVWDVCNSQTEVGALAYWVPYIYGNRPAGTMWARAWMHDTQNSVGQVVSHWSYSGWANAERSPTWRFTTYYPDEFQVEFMFVNQYNQVKADHYVAESTEYAYNAMHCKPPGGWAWEPHGW